jgi:hypothetical protein
MHFLIIIVLICVVFPVFARFVGSMFSAIFWLIVVAGVLTVFGASFR